MNPGSDGKACDRRRFAIYKVLLHPLHLRPSQLPCVCVLGWGERVEGTSEESEQSKHRAHSWTWRSHLPVRHYWSPTSLLGSIRFLTSFPSSAVGILRALALGPGGQDRWRQTLGHRAEGQLTFQNSTFLPAPAPAPPFRLH